MTSTIVVEIVNEQRERRTHAFARGPIRIGRNALNEVVIDKSFISQWHGAIHIASTGVFYVDLGSTNGTVLEGKRLAKNTPTPLSGDERTPLVLGKVAVFVRPARPGEEVSDVRTLSPGSSFDAPMAGKKATMMFNPHAGGDGTEMLVATSQRAILKDALSAVDGVRPAYEAYRQAFAGVVSDVRVRLERLPVSMRAPTLRNILRELPQLAREPEMAELVTSLGISQDVLNVFDTKDWLERLLPEAAASLGSVEVNVPVAMERVGATLETLAQSFVELRNGKAAFCEEMGLAAGADETPLSRCDSGRSVLEYLLDWDVEGLERLRELRRAFTDIAMHQVAVVAGVAEGGRELLENVSPEASGALMVRGSWLTRLLPTLRLGALRKRHGELLAEDGFTHVLFGRSFARAYFTVLGRES